MASDWDYSSSISWGKWVALACLIAAVIFGLFAVRLWSVRRIARGHSPIPGTTWMGLPDYNTAVNDRDGIPQVAAPAYNPYLGEEDAGFYDKDGNFHSRPRDAEESIASAAYRPSEPDQGPASTLPSNIHSSYYPPPPGSPPPRSSGESPVERAQNGEHQINTTQIPAMDAYEAPPGPPPQANNR